MSTAADHDRHKRSDGGYYSRGLAARQVALAGRIVAVANSYEVMIAVHPIASRSWWWLFATSWSVLGGAVNPNVRRAFPSVLNRQALARRPPRHVNRANGPTGWIRPSGLEPARRDPLRCHGSHPDPPRRPAINPLPKGAPRSPSTAAPVPTIKTWWLPRARYGA